MKNFMKSKTGKILIGVLTVVVIAVVCFVATHTFIDGRAYANRAECLDLQGKEVSVAHFDAVREAFPNTEILWDVPFQGGLIANTCPELEISVLSDEDVAMLDYLPFLKTVDARSCTDYPQLEALRIRRPEVEVLYNITLDGK